MTKPFDSERETRVLLEDVRSDLRIVAEGHTSIVKRLDKVEGSLQEVNGRLSRVETKIDRVENQVSQLQTKVDRVENQVNHLQDQVTSVLTDHESRLKTLEAK